MDISFPHSRASQNSGQPLLEEGVNSSPQITENKKLVEDFCNEYFSSNMENNINSMIQPVFIIITTG